jgi:tol-pal system protein YbgF
MFSNLKRAVSLLLLAGAAGNALAVSAPVSNVEQTTSSPVSVAAGSETEVQRLERLLRNSNRLQVQLQQQLEQANAEINELRGMVERNSYEMKKLLDRQRELFVELDKVRSDAQAAAQQPATVTDAADTSAQAPAGTFSTNEKEEEDYRSAVDLILKKKDYTGAIEAFKQFQVDYPESNFAPNAHYWLGQLYYASKQDIEATKSFASVVAYSESNKRADSLVKLGDIAIRNDKPDVAKKYYQQVISEYPGSASAKTAASRLK